MNKIKERKKEESAKLKRTRTHLCLEKIERGETGERGKREKEQTTVQRKIESIRDGYNRTKYKREVAGKQKEGWSRTTGRRENYEKKR